MVTVGLAFFGSCVGGFFKLELAIFGTDNGFGAGVSRVSKKLDMVVGNLKMSV